MSSYSPDAIPEVSTADVPDDAVLLDVREQDEWDAGHAPNAIHIPLAELPGRLGELPETDETVPVACRGGGRSSRAVAWLLQQGYDVANLTGGMKSWQAAGKDLVHADDSPPTVI